MSTDPPPDQAAPGPFEGGLSDGAAEDGERTPQTSARVASGSAGEQGRPLWTLFLTPAAVLLGSLVIGAAIIIGGQGAGGGAGTAVVQPAATPPVAIPTAAAPTPGPAASELFAGYAGELGLDVSAFRTCLADPAIETAVRDQQAAGVAAGVSGTPTTFVNDKMVVGAQPASILEEVIAAELAGSPKTLDGYSDAVKALASMVPPRFEITGKRPATSGAPIDGPADAAVVVVEFSDYACPFCARWHDENSARIPSAWPGRVAFAYLDFPLEGLHPNAVAASVAAGCAARQDRFWQMNDLLFVRQADWAGAPAE